MYICLMRILFFKVSKVKLCTTRFLPWFFYARKSWKIVFIFVRYSSFIKIEVQIHRLLFSHKSSYFSKSHREIVFFYIMYKKLIELWNEYDARNLYFSMKNGRTWAIRNYYFHFYLFFLLFPPLWSSEKLLGQFNNAVSNY